MAVLLTPGTAAAEGLTVSEMGGPEVLALMAVARVQTIRVPPTTLSPAAGVFAAQVQPVPAAETNVSPAGRMSVTVIVPAVFWPPIFETVIVKMPLVPTVKLPLCDFVSERSGAKTTVIRLALVLLPVNAGASVGWLIVATLVTLGAAAAATATVSVMLLGLVPAAAMTVALVHAMRVPPTTLSPAAGTFAVQVQPVPAAETKVSPAGRLSATV